MRKSEQAKLIVLYFIRGAVPTDADEAAAEAIEAAEARFTVRFRNGLVGDNDTLEICNAVAGDYIPPSYTKKYPTVNADGSTTMSLSDMKSDAPVRPVNQALGEEIGAPVSQPSQGGGLFGGFQSGGGNT